MDYRLGLWTIARNAEQAQKLYGSPKTPRNGSNYAKIEKDGQSSHNELRQEKRLQEPGRGFRDGGGCNFRTVKAPWSVLEIPVAAAVPELYKRGESRGKWCFVRTSTLEVGNFQ